MHCQFGKKLLDWPWLYAKAWDIPRLYFDDLLTVQPQLE